MDARCPSCGSPFDPASAVPRALHCGHSVFRRFRAFHSPHIRFRFFLSPFSSGSAIRQWSLQVCEGCLSHTIEKMRSLADDDPNRELIQCPTCLTPVRIRRHSSRS